jgi:hypothetical protein
MTVIDPSIKPKLPPRHSSDTNLGVIALLATLAVIAIFALMFSELLAHSRRWTPALYWEPVNAFLSVPTISWC